jgi:hypothetical protein
MKKADNFNPGQWLVENKLTKQSQLNELFIKDPAKLSRDYLFYKYEKLIDVLDPEKINNFSKLEDALENDESFSHLPLDQQMILRDKLKGIIQHGIDMER